MLEKIKAWIENFLKPECQIHGKDFMYQHGYEERWDCSECFRERTKRCWVTGYRNCLCTECRRGGGES